MKQSYEMYVSTLEDHLLHTKEALNALQSDALEPKQVLETEVARLTSLIEAFKLAKAN